MAGGDDDSRIAGGHSADAGLRIDKLLWYLRLSRSRAAAQALVAGGLVRVDGRRVERTSSIVHCGALLVLPGPPHVRALRLIALPSRRGPPAEAAACIVDLGVEGEFTTISDKMR